MTNSTTGSDYVDGSSSNSPPTHANRSPNPPPSSEESPRRHSGGNITPFSSPHGLPPMGVPGQCGPGLTGGLTGMQGAQAVPVGGSASGGTNAPGALIIGGSPSTRKRAREVDGSDSHEAAGGNWPVESEANTISCSMCGREFLSPKALFGHMRSHPDRGWKGVQPPPVFRVEEEEFADLHVDHQEILYDADSEISDADGAKAVAEGGKQKEEAGQGKGYRLPDLNYSPPPEFI